MQYLVAAAKKLAAHTAGATMVEYALLLALIVLVCAAVLRLIGQSVLPLYSVPPF